MLTFPFIAVPEGSSVPVNANSSIIPMKSTLYPKVALLPSTAPVTSASPSIELHVPVSLPPSTLNPHLLVMELPPREVSSSQLPGSPGPLGAPPAAPAALGAGAPGGGG